MKIFAPEVIVAKSRFWYFLRHLRKFKKMTGEIVSVKEVSGKDFINGSFCIFGDVCVCEIVIKPDYNVLCCRSQKNLQLGWRTSESGCVTTLVLEPTTCTVNTENWALPQLSPPATETWEPVIVLVPILSRYMNFSKPSRTSKEIKI